MYSRTAWSDYFTGSPTLIQSQTYGTQQTTSATSVHVSNCLFKSFTSGSNGGALFCSTSVTYLLVESSSFFSCKTSGQYGGAIYFKNANNGQSVLYEVCGYDCCSTYTSSSSNGQFSYIYVNNGASNKNYVNYSSITRCVIENSKSYYMLFHYFGKICCPSVNLSMNKCYSRSGIYCIPYMDSNYVTCSLLYSSFADNIATYYCCIKLWTTGAKYEIKNCNILRNTQGNVGTGGTIYTCGNLIIESSCALENTATYVFYQGSSYTITLSNCTVDSALNNGYLTIQNTITKSFIHALNHMSTRNCHSEYDSAGYITPVIQSPSSSKNQKHYCTYGNFIYHSQLRYLVSSLFVFLFNFIHLNASIDPFY
jgi:hypothetical protein